MALVGDASNGVHPRRSTASPDSAYRSLALGQDAASLMLGDYETDSSLAMHGVCKLPEDAGCDGHAESKCQVACVRFGSALGRIGRFSAGVFGGWLSEAIRRLYDAPAYQWECSEPQSQSHVESG